MRPVRIEAKPPMFSVTRAPLPRQITEVRIGIASCVSRSPSRHDHTDEVGVRIGDEKQSKVLTPPRPPAQFPCGSPSGPVQGWPEESSALGRVAIFICALAILLAIA